MIAIAEAFRIVNQDLGLSIGLLIPQEYKPSKELLKFSTFYKPIRKGPLAQSQLPPQIPGTTIHKPKGWWTFHSSKPQIKKHNPVGLASVRVRFSPPAPVPSRILIYQPPLRASSQGSWPVMKPRAFFLLSKHTQGNSLLIGYPLNSYMSE
jgi:hypothetical protein